MLAALASSTALRSRGFLSGSPPPIRAAMMISRIIRVKILPRLASSAPLLRLIVAHFEWPDINRPQMADKRHSGGHTSTCGIRAEHPIIALDFGRKRPERGG